MGHPGAEAGHIVMALLGVPLLAALLATEAKAVIFGFPLRVGAGDVSEYFVIIVC